MHTVSTRTVSALAYDGTSITTPRNRATMSGRKAARASLNGAPAGAPASVPARGCRSGELQHPLGLRAPTRGAPGGTVQLTLLTAAPSSAGERRKSRSG